MNQEQNNLQLLYAWWQGWKDGPVLQVKWYHKSCEKFLQQFLMTGGRGSMLTAKLLIYSSYVVVLLIWVLITIVYYFSQFEMQNP